MKKFFQRESIFLHRSLSLSSRFLLLAAAVTVVAAAFLPLWQIRLVAPQYEEGLSLHIYAHKLVGGNHGQDLPEINMLNHYIGMKPLVEEDFIEMRWMPFAFGAFALLALRAAVVGRMLSVVDLGVSFTYFTLFSLGSFYYRLHTYGHQLDPHAPMTIKPFTPILLGSQKIANFVQTSLPQTGGVLFTLFPIFIAAALWCSRKEEP
jgi:hypothetical protein